MTEQRPPLPPFTRDSAIQKVRAAEDGWNSRDAEKVALAYTVDSEWRNRSEFVHGRGQIVEFLQRKWRKEQQYRLIKELWAWQENRIAVRFAYEWCDDSGNWFRSYGNENWEFDKHGLMQTRYACINDLPIAESERLSRLTHDLLTLQRIDDNAMPMELSRVNLRELATGVLDALEPILRDRHANTEIVGEAPDVLGDPDRLKQAVTNLVENASRFIEPDGHITIELFGLKGNSILAVKDDGTGFGDIDPQLLFDRFYRTDASRSRGTGGTGLGLAIVKSVVESHDGTVEAINLPDGGACFIIALPSILPGER